MNAIIKWQFRDTHITGPRPIANYLSYIRGQVIDRQLLQNDFEAYKSDLIDTEAKDPTEIGLFHSPDLSEEYLEESLANHQGNIWIPIISLKEDNARKFNLVTEEDFRILSDEIVHIVSETLNIPMTNVNYLAAFHTKPPVKQKTAGSQPHIHFLIWEDQPIRQKGKISKADFTSLLNSIDKMIGQYFELQQLKREEFDNAVPHLELNYCELPILSSEIFAETSMADVDEAIDFLQTAQDDHLWLRDIVAEKDKAEAAPSQDDKPQPSKSYPTIIKRLQPVVGYFFSVKTLKEKLQKIRLAFLSYCDDVKKFVTRTFDNLEASVYNLLVRHSTVVSQPAVMTAPKVKFEVVRSLIEYTRVKQQDIRDVEDAITTLAAASINVSDGAFVDDPDLIVQRLQTLRDTIINNPQLKQINIKYILEKIDELKTSASALSQLQTLYSFDDIDKALDILGINTSCLPEPAQLEIKKHFEQDLYADQSQQEDTEISL